MSQQVKHMMLNSLAEYESKIGYKIDNKSRLIHFVQDRIALANSWRPYTSYREIGEVFGMDHSSIVHYCKQHDRMINSCPSYSMKFSDAMRATHEAAESISIAPRIKFGSQRNLHQELMIIENTIKNLQQMKTKSQIKLGINEEST